MSSSMLSMAALLAAACAALVVPRGPAGVPQRPRGLPWGAGDWPGRPGTVVASGDPPAHVPLRRARQASGVLGAAAWLLLGGALGPVVALLVVLVVPPALARLEPAVARRRRLELVRSAPLVADLLAAALAAGVPLDRAATVVARAVGGPAEGVLLAIHRRVALGEAAALAWSAAAGLPGMGVIARTVARSSRTGAPLADLLGGAGADLRAAASAAALAEVRATAVRAVLPLGLCLLPAFTLLGVVPIVGGLVPAL